jgi:2-polyprenyl-3-methyl-5-hydroxy-6-metoxy-1,4-benzoquinol methylase
MQSNMQDSNWFKTWFNTSYYHKLYFKRNIQEAGAFLDKLVEQLQLPTNAKVLDVACGKGRHSLWLAKYGFQVTGIDLSAESINYAIKQNHTNTSFYVHDMRYPFTYNYFDAVVNLFTSFGYFNSHVQNTKALIAMQKNLKPNGVLVLDYLNPNYVSAHLVPEEEKNIDSVKYNISKWQDENQFYKKIEIYDRENELNLSFTEVVEKITKQEFENMFALANLKIQHIWGSYMLNSFDNVLSPRIIIQATKAN